MGDSWDCDRLLNYLIDNEEVESTVCRGAHWAFALVYALRGDHSRRLLPSVRDRAEKRLAQVVEEGVSELEEFTLPLSPSEVVRLGHLLSWLIPALDYEDLATGQAIHKVVKGMAVALQMIGNEIPYREACHAVHALRLYKDRICGGTCQSS